MIRKIQIQGLSVLALSSAGLLIAGTFMPAPVREPVLWVFGWAGLESLAAFFALTWGIERSNKAFYASYIGGALLRLASLGIAAACFWTLKIPPAIPLLSLVGAYFLLSMVQLPFYQRLVR